MILPLYRPEITTYELIDGVWLSTHGEFIWTFFRSMEDESMAAQGTFRRDVRNGSKPAYMIEVPRGSSLETRGWEQVLRTPTGETRGWEQVLRTPTGKVFNGAQALIVAIRALEGFSLAREDRDHDQHPELEFASPSIAPPLGEGPSKQLSLFGDLGEPVRRTSRERRLSAKGGALS